jgi:hypothetical protein
VLTRPIEHLMWSKDLRPGSCQLKSQRYSLKVATQLGYIDGIGFSYLEVGARSLGSVNKQLYAGAFTEFV